MKTVVVQSYCDLCVDEGRNEVPATEERTYDGYLLDLCADHEVKVGELLIVLVGMFKQGAPVEEEVKVPVKQRRKRGHGTPGRPTIAVKESVEWRTCPDCGYITPTRSALGAHCKQRHDTVLGDYTWST